MGFKQGLCGVLDKEIIYFIVSGLSVKVQHTGVLD